MCRESNNVRNTYQDSPLFIRALERKFVFRICRQKTLTLARFIWQHLNLTHFRRGKCSDMKKYLSEMPIPEILFKFVGNQGKAASYSVQIFNDLSLAVKLFVTFLFGKKLYV